MRREVLYLAIKRLLTDLEASNVSAMLRETFENARPGKEAERAGLISLDIFKKLTIAESHYSEAEKSVIEILGLSPLYDVKFWEKLSSEAKRSDVFDMYRSVAFATNQLPKILDLIQQENWGLKNGSEETLPRELEGKSVITFLLPEAQGEYSSPQRLISALQAVVNIYGVECTLAGTSELDLIVSAIDSGSDKSLDFLGIAKLMEQVRKLVTDIWDRRVFYRHMQVSQCISLIADSLPVIAKIDEMRTAGSLSPEQAELLKRRTLQGVTQFLEAGVVTADMDAAGTHSPRQLMRPEQKLLAAPLIHAADQPEEALGSKNVVPEGARKADAITDDEVRELERLVTKARNSVVADADPPVAVKRKPRSKDS